MTTAIKSLTKRGQKGFTLIELLVVIAIIAILAALILAALGSAQKGARDSQRLNDLNQIKTAASSYQADTGNWPASIAAIGTNYLNPAPTAPQSGPANAQAYAYFSGGTGFVACVQSERDTANYFWSISTGTDKSNGAMCTAADIG